MDMTLHRAFDMCRDPFEALEQAAELGIGTIRQIHALCTENLRTWAESTHLSSLLPL